MPSPHSRCSGGGAFANARCQQRCRTVQPPLKCLRCLCTSGVKTAGVFLRGRAQRCFGWGWKWEDTSCCVQDDQVSSRQNGNTKGKPVPLRVKGCLTGRISRIIRSFSCRTSFYYYLSSVQLGCLDHVAIAIPAKSTSGPKESTVTPSPATNADAFMTQQETH